MCFSLHVTSGDQYQTFKTKIDRRKLMNFSLWGWMSWEVVVDDPGQMACQHLASATMCFLLHSGVLLRPFDCFVLSL